MFDYPQTIEKAVLEFQADLILAGGCSTFQEEDALIRGTGHCDALSSHRMVPIETALREFEHSMQGRYGRYLTPDPPVIGQSETEFRRLNTFTTPEVVH